jgi:hypothetical protein
MGAAGKVSESRDRSQMGRCIVSNPGERERGIILNNVANVSEFFCPHGKQVYYIAWVHWISSDLSKGQP